MNGTGAINTHEVRADDEGDGLRAQPRSDPEGEMMGVDTEKDDREEESRVAHNIIAALWYKGKAVLTGVVLKILTVKLAAYNNAFFLKPHTAAFAAAIWDSMTCHAVMKSAELRAIGAHFLHFILRFPLIYEVFYNEMH